MRTDELIAGVREAARISDAHPDFTDTRLLRELYDAEVTLFGDAMCTGRQGIWLQRYNFQTVAGQAYYRMPRRAAVSNPESIEVLNDNGNRVPHDFVMMGDGFELNPTPTAVKSARVNYYLRPSRLIAFQEAVKGEIGSGYITAVDSDARTIEVDEVPDDALLSTPTVITSGSVNVDVVRADGTHDLVMVDASQTLVGTTFTITDDLIDMTKIQVGDYLRAADQAEWPQLPQDYHRTLVDATASVVLMSIGNQAKAQQLAAKASADIARLMDQNSPRPRNRPKKAVPKYGVLRNRGRYVGGRVL